MPSDVNGVGSQHLICDLYFQKNSGFIIGPNNQLLLWAPPSYYPFSFHNPQQPKLKISACSVIDLSHMSHGLAWHQCYTPSNTWPLGSSNNVYILLYSYLFSIFHCQVTTHLYRSFTCIYVLTQSTSVLYVYLSLFSWGILATDSRWY